MKKLWLKKAVDEEVVIEDVLLEESGVKVVNEEPSAGKK
jgi:hypothetical protein